MNCVLYARVSTDKQAEKELSIPAQLQAMRDYARHHGWVVVEEFLEPGASAKTVERPALQQLLTKIRNRESKVDVVLVHKLDRLCRNTYDFATIKALLKQHQTRLASVVENADESVSGELVENIMASIAQFYSANLADETRKGMRQLVLRGGWPHRPPRGYVMVRGKTGREGSRCEIHPREGPLIARAFELFATGFYSIQALSNRLAKDGLVSSVGASISHSHLRRVVTNEFYVGRVKWQGLDVPGQHKALVSRTLFDKVQAILKDRYRNPGAKGRIGGFPLRGFAICASCRGRLTAERHGRWAYYRCGRQVYRRELCSARFCNAERAHADLERLLRQTQLTRSTAADIQRAADRLIRDRAASAQKRETTLKREQARLVEAEMRLTDMFTCGDLSPNVYKGKADELRSTRSKVDAELERACVPSDDLRNSVMETLQIATSLWDIYERLNDLKRAELLRTVFKSVVLASDGIVGYALKPPFDALRGRSTTTRSSAQLGARAILKAA